MASNAIVTQKNGKLPWNERLSYGISDFACSFSFNLVGTYLMYFYTDVFGITASAVGTLMLVARVIDAIDGPIWGILIDHTHTKWGKSRPFFLWFNAPFTFFSILCFTTPDLPMTWKIVWAYVTYIGVDVLYSAINIPLTSILPSMTTDPDERVLLSTIRSLFSNFGGTLISVIALPLVALIGGKDESKGFFWVAVLGASVFFVLYLIAFFNLREHVQTRSSQKPLPVKQSIKALKNNWPWLIVVMEIFIYWIGMSAKGQVTMYFFKYNLDAPGLIPLALFFNAAGIVSVFLTPLVVGKLGKKKTMLAGLMIGIVGQAILGLGAHMLNIPIVIIGIIVGNFGNGFVGPLPAVLLSDAVDYGEWKNGVRAEGIVTSASSFTAKFGMGLGGAITGWLLALGNYVPNKTQKASSLLSIEFNYVWIPLIALFIGFVLVLFYNLTTDKEKIMNHDLAIKHHREEQEDLALARELEN